MITFLFSLEQATMIQTQQGIKSNGLDYAELKDALWDQLKVPVITGSTTRISSGKLKI